MKTNAVRMLDTLGIEYELLSYDVDPDNLVATATAAKLGLPADQVFKTLVVQGNRHGIALAVLPGNYQLDFTGSVDGRSQSRNRCPKAGAATNWLYSRWRNCPSLQKALSGFLG